MEVVSLGVVRGGSFTADVKAERVVFPLPSNQPKRRTIKAENIQELKELPNGGMSIVVRLHRDLIVPTSNKDEYGRLAAALNKLVSDVKTAKKRRKEEARRAKLERDSRAVNRSTALWWRGTTGGRRG